MATDPRDKVYGFLGLCTDNIIQADYRLEPQKVYKLITKRYLLKDGNLRIITAPSSPVSVRSDSLPSWVPDWAATDVATPLALRTEPLPEVSYDATSGSRWTPGFSEDGNQLLVEAQFIDGVAELGPSRQPYRPTTPGAKSLFKQLRAELDVSANWQKVCLGNAGGWDNDWQVLLAGSHPSDRDKCREQARKVWRLFRKYVVAHRLGLMPLWVFGLMDRIAKLTGQTIFLRRPLAAAMADDFETRVRRAITYRRMMRTSGGYLGLSPALARVGDRVALLKRLNTPAFLRRGSTHWELVEECSIHGIMHGQAFQPESCEQIWLA
ncbi:hypothetical protein VUR80DRAFT_9566 [Thermomyces stellatus]